MKILMLVHSLRRGGAERVLLEVALGLQYRGHKVEIVSWLNVDEYPDEAYRAVKRTFLLDKNKYKWPYSIIETAKELRKKVTEFKPDVIELHTHTVAWLVAWAGIKIPCLHVLHGYGLITSEEGYKNKFIRKMNRIVARAIHTSFVVVSGSMVPAAAQYFKIKKESISVVPNGVDLNKFNYVQPGFKNKERLIISMIGTLYAQKGQLLGIIAFEKLTKILHSAILQIVGEGPDSEKLKELVNAKRLNDQVAFLGRQNNIQEILSNTHILWQLSESEAMPMIVLESMSAGVPVIGFNVRGIKDAVLDGKTGLLCNYGDTASIVESTVQVLNNSVLYAKYSLNSRRRTEKYFSLENMIKSHEIILQNLMNKNYDAPGC